MNDKLDCLMRLPMDGTPTVYVDADVCLMPGLHDWAERQFADLDFTDLNHTFTAADIVATFDNTITDGFKYVLPYDTDNIYNVRQMKLQRRLKKVKK